MSATAVERVTDPGDPRLRDYLALRDVQLRTRTESEEGLFIAEGETTIRRAIAAGYAVRSVLIAERREEALADLAGEGPLLVATDDLLEATTGFSVHRGALAAMDRRPLPALTEVVRDAALVAVCEDISDHTNLGALFRSAAALGVDAVLLTPRCADPLYRRAIRTSMGAVFSVPWTRIDWYHGPKLLHEEGLTLAALTPSADATSLRDVDRANLPRLALAVGSEGDGLSERWLTAADLRVRIPMREGIDSLNVAAAAAVAFFALSGGAG